MGNKSTDKSEKTEKTEAFTVKKLAEWISIKKIAVAVGFAFFASMVPNWLLAFIARPSGDDYGYSAASHQTWLHTHSVIEVFRKVWKRQSRCARSGMETGSVFLYLR